MSERFVSCLLGKTPLGEPPHSFNLDFHTIKVGVNYHFR